MRRLASVAAVAAVLPLLAFGPAKQPAPTHWALLVGITDYINFGDVEGGDLPGAEHDARSVRDLLVMKFRVPEENIRLLLSRDATRAAIEESITGWLASNAQPQDQVTIFFAGHGSQMWDESGDEDDGLDETLAPADVLATSTENDISDDTFNEWLGMLRTSNVVVTLDNCNSGTGTRDVTPFSRGRLLARDISAVERPVTASRRALPGAEDATGFDATQTRVLEFAAAQPHQVAVDAFFPATDGSESFHGGAFTTFLVRELWKAPATATYQEAFDAAHEALKRNRFQQDPYLSEDVALKDQPLFFVEGGARANEMALPVTSVSGSVAQLAAGLALGVTAGSVLETESGARLVVASVGQRSTVANVTSGSVRAGDQARLVAFRYSVSPLLVNVAAVDSRIVAGLRSALSGSDEIRLVENEDAFAHLIVRRGGDQLRVVGSDGFARHTDLGVDQTGISRLADALRKEAASKYLGDMDNPTQGFGVHLELLGGGTSFGLGEEIGFAIESERDGYLTLVDLGTDGTVAMLLPNAETASIRVRAGQRFQYPDPNGDLLFQAQEPAGTGLVRAFVTSEPLDIAIPSGEDYAFGGAAFAAQVAAALKAIAGEIDGAVRLDTWGTASIVYDITN
ncbi:MAG: caspase family protein [Gemmatimonadota bacterium]|nr:caspase family protein [Gemmatimonadota bacterium]